MAIGELSAASSARSVRSLGARIQERLSDQVRGFRALGLFVVCVLSLALGVPTSMAADLAAAQAAFDRGAYAVVEESLSGPDVEGGTEEARVVLLARTLSIQDRYDEAISLLQRALKAESTHVDVRTELGRTLVRVGRYSEAIDVLDAAVEGEVGRDPEARYWRAAAFMRTGRSSRGAMEYRDFIREYNQRQVQDAAHLALVARACMALGLPADANDAFREALEADPTSIDTRLAWASLFLERYRPDEAASLLDEVLEVNPSHPLALAARARAEIMWTYDVDRATRLAELAFEVHPHLPEALEVLAEIAIDSRRFADALAYLERVNLVTPGRPEAMALQAAVYWLQDDMDGYRALEEATLRAAPDYAQFYVTVGEFGVRNFRYVESLRVFQQALDVDAGFWPAYVSLGIGYSRVADDVRALSFLQRAFDNDPFNVRAYYMVEFFERALEEYQTIQDSEIDAIRYRFHRSESEVLSRFVPPVVRASWRTYVERYGVTPPAPVSIEIFHDRASFGIRSIGLPHASQHGICFGHVVTSRSPSEGDFNWRQVIEHEVSHVFSLTASNYRVPRWLTEGMAEYDTILSREEWRRKEELSVVRSLQQDSYISVLELNDAFVSLDDFDQILAAYFQASLVVEYIGENWGYDALVSMLHAYGRSLETPEVFETVLGLSVEAFDARFEAHLRELLAPQMPLYEPSISTYRDADALRAQLEQTPDSADVWADLAAAVANAGALAEARTLVMRALGLDASHPFAHWTAAQLSVATGDLVTAGEHFNALLEMGRESHTARVHLGSLAHGRGELARAVEHLSRAIELYPQGVEAHRELAEVYESLGELALRRAHLERVAILDQNDVTAPLALARIALSDEAYGAGLEWAEMALNVALFDRNVHRVRGRLAHGAEVWDTALESLETELVLGPEDRSGTLTLLLAVYEALGMQEEAARVRRQLD